MGYYEEEFQREEFVMKENKALRYNEGKRQWSLLDFDSIEELIKVLEYGAKKYTVGDISGRDNWKKGLVKEEILESAMRHLKQLFSGETIDPESGCHHMGHLMCNAMFYLYFERNNKFVKK